MWRMITPVASLLPTNYPDTRAFRLLTIEIDTRYRLLPVMQAYFAFGEYKVNTISMDTN